MRPRLGAPWRGSGGAGDDHFASATAARARSAPRWCSASKTAAPASCRAAASRPMSRTTPGPAWPTDGPAPGLWRGQPLARHPPAVRRADRDPGRANRPDDPAARELLALADARVPAIWISDGERRLSAPAGASRPGPGPSSARFDPPPRLVVFGGDPTALAVASLGAQSGFQTTLVRPKGPTSPPPLPGVAYRRDDVADAVATIGLDAWTAVAICGHDEEVDHQALLAALPSAAPYVGLLGARRRLGERLDRLRAAGVGERDLQKAARADRPGPGRQGAVRGGRGGDRRDHGRATASRPWPGGSHAGPQALDRLEPLIARIRDARPARSRAAPSIESPGPSCISTRTADIRVEGDDERIDVTAGAPIGWSPWPGPASSPRRPRPANRPYSRVAGLAAGLLDQAHGLDDHALLGGLEHVVDRQAGHRDGGQGLHLDARLALQLDPGHHRQPALGRLDRHLDLGQRQRVAERDQVGGLLGRHHPGDLGHGADVALAAGSGDGQGQGLGRSSARSRRRSPRGPSRPCRRRRPCGRGPGRRCGSGGSLFQSLLL
jgi:hypothetical protein